MTDLERAPFVKTGLVVEALWADAVDRPKFYSSMGLNFEKIIGDALAAARREGYEEAGLDRARKWDAVVEAAYNNGKREGAAEMRKRAARAVAEPKVGASGWSCHINAEIVRALPLTPEEPT